MMRVRLKADGRLVEVTSEGQERVLPPPLPEESGLPQEKDPDQVRYRMPLPFRL